MRLTSDAAAMGFSGGKPVANRGAQKRAQRRRVLEGYPWGGQFETKEQVDDYLAGDTIVCLECGAPKRNLGVHLLRLHDMAVDTYKVKYGLAWSIGLCCTDSRKRRQAAGRKRVEENPEFAALLARGRTMNTHKTHVRSPAPYIGNENMRRLGVVVIDADTATTMLLERMGSSRTVVEVLADPDMPGRSWLTSYLRETPALKARLAEAIEAQPFAVQARAESLGPRFKAAVAELFNLGYSCHRAAVELGVSSMTVNKAMQPLRKAAQ